MTPAWLTAFEVAGFAIGTAGILIVALAFIGWLIELARNLTGRPSPVVVRVRRWTH